MTTVTTSLRDSGVFRIHGHSSHSSTTTTPAVSLAELAALDHKTWLYEDTTLKLRYRLRKAALRNVDAQKRYYDTIANHRKLCDSQVQNESREFYELYKRIVAHVEEPRPSINAEPELSGTQEIEVWTQVQRLRGDNGIQRAADLLRTRNSTARHVYVTLAALHKVDSDLEYLAAVCNAACLYKEVDSTQLTTQTKSLQQQHKPITNKHKHSLHASTPRSYTTVTNNTNSSSTATTLPASTFICQALAFLNNNYNTCNFSKLETLILQIYQASQLSTTDAATTILKHLGQFSYLSTEWLRFTSSLCTLDKSHLQTVAEYYFGTYVKDLLVNPEQYGMCHDFYISPAQRSQMNSIHSKLLSLSQDPSTRGTHAIFGKFASGTPQHLNYRTHHNPAYVVLSPGELKSLGVSYPRNFTTWHVFNIEPHTVAFTYFSPLHQLIRNYDTSSEDVSVLLAQASAKELSQGNWNQAQEFHDASITSGDIVALQCALAVQLDQYTTECERLETEVCLYNRSIESFRDKTSQLVKAMGTLRNKVWYVTQVRNSEVYVRASCVAQKLADPESTPSFGPVGAFCSLDSKSRRPSSVVSTASRESFFKRLSLGYNKRRQRQSIISLPSEITMFAPPSFAGPNKLSDRESDATRRWLEEQRKQNLCQGEERLHRFYCEVDDLCQRLIAELAVGGSPLFPEKRTPQNSEDLHMFLVSIVYSDLGSGWFAGSETDQWLSSELVKTCLSVKHAPPRALRHRSSILSIGTVATASTVAPASCEQLGTPQKTCSSPTESYFSMRSTAQGGAFRLTLPPSAATSASSAPITPVKVNSGSTAGGNVPSATPLPPTFKLTLPNTPSAAVEARLPDGIPISIPSCITPVISGAICSNTLSAPFPYERAYSEILSKFSTVTSPHAKMQCLYELETLVVAALTAGTRSDPGADAIVEELQSLFRSDLRPKTLFRDLQMIAAFAPLDNLDLSYSGKMFWDVVLAALSIKHEAVECMVEAANEIFQNISEKASSSSSSTSTLAGFGMKECGELWTIAAKEGNSVAQRELGIMQLSHPGEVSLCVMPLTRLNELFEDMPDCSTSDLDKLDPTRMAIVRHWMRCAAKAGDNIAREYLEQGGGWL